MAKDIQQYYYSRLAELPATKQFHFASRLSAWCNDPAARIVLEQMRITMLPDHSAERVTILSEHLQHKAYDNPTMPAAALRLPYFAAYPQLYGLELALFRVRHWLSVYGVDARQQLQQVIPSTVMLDLEKAILADDQAVRILSTYIVNVSYLLHRVVLQDDTIDVQHFYDIGKAYDLDDAEQLRLYLYLYTHCIIAASNFYTQPVPDEEIPIYRQMLADLEQVIAGRYNHLSLDTKLEFLVCCHILGFETSLAAPIYQECERSLSPEGTFLIDTHNQFADNQHKKTFAASEHRNVLYIMSTLPYQHRL